MCSAKCCERDTNVISEKERFPHWGDTRGFLEEVVLAVGSEAAWDFTSRWDLPGLWAGGGQASEALWYHARDPRRKLALSSAQCCQAGQGSEAEGFGPLGAGNWNFQIWKLQRCGQTGSILGPLLICPAHDVSPQGKGKGAIFSAACQGACREAAQKALEAPALRAQPACRAAQGSSLGVGTSAHPGSPNTP